MGRQGCVLATGSCQDIADNTLPCTVECVTMLARKSNPGRRKNAHWEDRRARQCCQKPSCLRPSRLSFRILQTIIEKQFTYIFSTSSCKFKMLS